ncbi:hypothetical protein WJX81_007996 [Elliptochloris bilobata]|uniref:Uncharacterized protein n=1 Tax=Elliptochloris bilobata TaxID=381761 RepID=A0AAW1SEY6_9CHLO
MRGEGAAAASASLLVGLGLDCDEAERVLIAGLEAARDLLSNMRWTGSMSPDAAGVPAQQIEGVCHALLELPMGVRDLGPLLLACPALLACKPAALLEQAEQLRRAGSLKPKALLALVLRNPSVLLSATEAAGQLEELAAALEPWTAQPRSLSSLLRALAERKVDIDVEHLLAALAPHVTSAFTVKELVRGCPKLLARDVARPRAVVACLADAGLAASDLERLLLGCPEVLLMDPADVQLKLRFLTDFLGERPARAALSSRLLFHSSVPNRIGPRFAFVKSRGAARALKNPSRARPSAAELAPSTLLKSTDQVFCQTVGCEFDEFIAFKVSWQAMYAVRLGRSRGHRTGPRQSE